MAASLIQSVQDKLGISVAKIDPNTQDVKGDDTSHSTHSLDQAALPTVLAGLYKYSLNDGGAGTIFKESTLDWVSLFFGKNTQEVAEHVAEYASTTPDEAIQRMNTIASTAANVIREDVKGNNDADGVHQYLLQQRREILLYLPDQLHIGDMLGDNTLDDRTKKMEGPVSSLLNKLGNIFNSTEKKPESKSHF